MTMSDLRKRFQARRKELLARGPLPNPEDREFYMTAEEHARYRARSSRANRPLEEIRDLPEAENDSKNELPSDQK